MRRKEQNTSPLRPVANNFLSALNYKNFQRCRLDSGTLAHLCSLLRAFRQHLTDPAHHVPVVIRTATDSLLLFQSNLLDHPARHQVTHQDLTRLFTTLTELLLSIAQAQPDYDKLVNSDVMLVMWSLLQPSVQNATIPDDEASIDLLNGLFSPKDIEGEKVYDECILREQLSLLSIDSKGSIAGHFISFLRQGVYSDQLRQVLLKFVNQCLLSNHLTSFRRGVALLEHIGNSYEQRRKTLQNVAAKSLQFNNCLPFIESVHKAVALGKLIGTDYSISFALKLIERVVEKNSTSPTLAKMLEELIHLNYEAVSEQSIKMDVKFDQLLLRVTDWISVRSSSRGSSEENQIKERLFQHSPELKEEKIIEFVKKLSNRRSNDDTDTPQTKKMVSILTSIIKSLSVNHHFKTRVSLHSLENLTFLKGNDRPSDLVKNFLIEVLPDMLQTYTPSPTEPSPLKLAVTLRRAQLQSQKSSPSQNLSNFKEVFCQLVHSESLNYHFVVSSIFLRSLTDRTVLVEYLLDQLKVELSLQKDSNRNIILIMGLFLKAGEGLFHTQPVKFRLRQLLRDPLLCAQPLNIEKLIELHPRQSAILKNDSSSLPAQWPDCLKMLNNSFEKYTQDNSTLFYSLIVALNDMSEESGSGLLSEIGMMKRMSLLSEGYTIIRAFIENIKSWRQQGSLNAKKIVIFLMIIKLHTVTQKADQLRDNPDLQLCAETLTQYLTNITSNLTRAQLVQISRLKSNKAQYNEGTFMEMISQHSFIKFYAHCRKDTELASAVMVRVGLMVLRKIMAQIESQDITSTLKDLYLLYLVDEAPKQLHLGDRQTQQMKSYVLLMLLTQSEAEDSESSKALESIKENLGVAQELILDQHTAENVQDFKQRHAIDWVGFSVRNVYKCLETEDQQASLMLKMVVDLIDQELKINLSAIRQGINKQLTERIGEHLPAQLVKRIQRGLEVPQQQRASFTETSSNLCRLLKLPINNIGHSLLPLVEDIIVIDVYSECSVSALLLRQVAHIFGVVDNKSAELCETIFNYILTLTDIFPGEERLQISNFICQVFELSAAPPKQLSLDKINRFLSSPTEVKAGKPHDKDHPNMSSKYGRGLPQPNQGGLFKGMRGHEYVPVPAPPQDSLQRMIRVGSNPMPRSLRQHLGVPPELNQFIQEEEEQDRGGRWYDNPYMGASREGGGGIPFGGSRYDRYLADREKEREDNQLRGNDRRPPPHFVAFMRDRDQEREKDHNKEKEKEKEVESEEPEFEDQQYEQFASAMEEQLPLMRENSTILKKSALLPKFIDLMHSFCQKRSQKYKAVGNYEDWKVNFVNPSMQKIAHLNFKLHNNGSFSTEIRRQNQINNVSCVLIKRTITQNNRFIVIASSSDMVVFSKEKVMMCAAEGKTIQGHSHIQRHSVPFEIHTVEFAPHDKSLLVVSGLHNMGLFTLSNDGSLAKTPPRYSVNNMYINKVKLAKIGIFVGVDKEIRVLNYQCKLFLTLRPQEGHTLVREWSIFEKAAGCQVFFVCPNGTIWFAEVLPSDEGRKEFTGRVQDQRKTKSGTGASVLVKEIPDMGKFLFASFKDGYNILGRLEGDRLEDMTDIRLKGAVEHEKNLFNNLYILGHVDIVKLPKLDEVYVIATVKKYFPPETAFNQGLLMMVRLTKDGDSSVQIINQDSFCEYFQVVYVGERSFFVISVHSEGSVVISSPSKINRGTVDQEIQRLRESQQAGSSSGEGNAKSQQQHISQLRKAIDKQLTLDSITSQDISSAMAFREQAEPAKAEDFTLNKLDDLTYQMKQTNFNKIVTGINLPQPGIVQLPNRKVQNAYEVGLTPLESLFYFAHGNFKFTYRRQQESSQARDQSNPNTARLLEKLDRDYSGDPQDRMPGMISSYMPMRQNSNQEPVLISKSFDVFKRKLPKLEDYFPIEGDDESNSIEKTALIIKMFLSRCLREGGQCSQADAMRLVEAVKGILPSANKRLFVLLREVIVLGVKVCQRERNNPLSLENDENYPLRAATEGRFVHFYNRLKMDITQQDLNEFLELLLDILKEDTQLMTFYVAKHSNFMIQLHRRLKKPDTQYRADALIQLYCLGYPVLKYCEIPCGWMLANLISIVYSYIGSRSIRECLFASLRRCRSIQLQPWLKNLAGKEGVVENVEIEEQEVEQQPPDEGPKDQMTEIFNMFNRGEIDEDTFMKMLQEASKIEYERAQEVNQPAPEMEEEVQPELEMEMEVEQKPANLSLSIMRDLIDECTESLADSLESELSRIVVLYVTHRAADGVFGQVAQHLLKRIKKLASEVDLAAQGDKLSACVGFSSLIRRVLKNNKYLQESGGKRSAIYQQIEGEALSKLSKVELEGITKVKSAPNYLTRIMKGEKIHSNTHIAYALTNLLLQPCEPSHALLSLQCYWLLPESPEFYSKLKDLSNIRDGVTSGNIQKVYDIARANPPIWRESGEYLQVMQEWIQERKNGWELALELLEIYYGEEQ